MKKLLVVLLLLLSACSSKPEPYELPQENSVYYEIFVASFYDSDGDGRGDLQGVIKKLDYIQKDLGATGIWLMPIGPSPSYHKYDVKDYKAIDPAYGTMSDFDELVEAMDERGMDLILDLVINHSSREHPWFLEAKEGMLRDSCTDKCDYYTFSDKMVPGYNMITQDLYYESEFSDTMPDLNLDNENVRNEIKDITKFWLDKGIKGFRLDATTHYYADNLDKNIAFLTWFSDYAKSIKEDVYIVGEAWKNSAIIQPMYASGVSFFNFSLGLNNGRLTKDIKRKSGQDLSEFMSNYQNTIDDIQPGAIDSIFYSNHDQGRSASYFANQIDKQKLAASVYLLLPGNVFVYYGEEIGMTGSGVDPNKRLPMLWGEKEGMTLKPVGSDYAGEMKMDLISEMKDKDSIWNHYSKVISVRNKYPQISRGTPKSVDLGDNALFAMQLDDLIVVHNFSDETLSFEGDYEIVDKSLGGSESKGIISLNAYNSVIIKKRI